MAGLAESLRARVIRFIATIKRRRKVLLADEPFRVQRASAVCFFAQAAVLIGRKRCSAATATIADFAAIALAHSILGILPGDIADTRAQLEAALDRDPHARRATTVYLGFEGKILAKRSWRGTCGCKVNPIKPSSERARRSRRRPRWIIF